MVPALIVLAAEVEERLRQTDSPLRSAARFAAQLGVALPRPLGGARARPRGGRGPARHPAWSPPGWCLGRGRRRAACAPGRRRRRSTSTPHARPPRRSPAAARTAHASPSSSSSRWILVGSVWGVDLSAALTAFGVTSLVISFALQDTLSGLASGVLSAERSSPSSPATGSRRTASKAMVVDVNWRTTRHPRSQRRHHHRPEQHAGKRQHHQLTAHRLHCTAWSCRSRWPTRTRRPSRRRCCSTPHWARRRVSLRPGPEGAVVTQIDDPLMGYEVHMWIDDYAIAPAGEERLRRRWSGTSPTGTRCPCRARRRTSTCGMGLGPRQTASPPWPRSGRCSRRIADARLARRRRARSPGSGESSRPVRGGRDHARFQVTASAACWLLRRGQARLVLLTEGGRRGRRR